MPLGINIAWECKDWSLYSGSKSRKDIKDLLEGGGDGGRVGERGPSRRVHFLPRQVSLFPLQPLSRIRHPFDTYNSQEANIHRGFLLIRHQVKLLNNHCKDWKSAFPFSQARAPTAPGHLNYITILAQILCTLPHLLPLMKISISFIPVYSF